MDVRCIHLAMVAVQESMPKKQCSHAVNQGSLSPCRLVKPSLRRSHSLPLKSYKRNSNLLALTSLRSNSLRIRKEQLIMG